MHSLKHKRLRHLALLGFIGIGLAGMLPTEAAAGSVAGQVDLKILYIVAATAQVPEALDSNRGVEPFNQISIPDVTMNAGDGNALLPPITPEMGFIIPRPKLLLNPTLGLLVRSASHVVSAEPATGTYDPASGSLTFQDLDINLYNKQATVDLTLPALTTEPVPAAGIPVSFLNNAGIPMQDGNIVGCRMHDDGSMILVSMADINKATGSLAAAKGKMAILIRAKALCTDGTTECMVDQSNPASFQCAP